MKKEKKAFYLILAVVLVTGLIFSLYVFSRIRAIHELRASIGKIVSERAQTIDKDSDSSSDTKKPAILGTGIPQKIWTTEFIETVYNVSRKYGIRDLTFEQKTQGGSNRPAQGNSRVSLHPYPVRITFHAGYREMADFIKELQGYEKLVTIDSLKVRRERNSIVPQRVLFIEMTAITYTMEEE